MEQPARQSDPALPTAADDQRALRILAKSVYRELKSTGYERSDIVGFTSALLELLTDETHPEPLPSAS